MLDCDACRERIADFLLDELPESEAVLVQEHLNLCAACMRTYRELKGTGKALDAVPSMRPVEGSTEFKQAVRAQAIVELNNLLARLTPEKRLRVEALRAARMSRPAEKPPTVTARYQPVSPLSVGLLLAVLVSLVIVLAILLYPRGGSAAASRDPVGTLKVTAGRVEQFFQKAGEPHSPVQEGRTVLPGDSFSTRDKSVARFDLHDGTALFLGPDSRVTFRAASAVGANSVVVLENGILGVWRPEREATHDEAPPPVRCEVRSDAGAVLLDDGAHAYVTVKRNGKDCTGEVLVLAAGAEVVNRTGRTLGTVPPRHAAALPPDTAALLARPIEKPAVPSWRLDVVCEEELVAVLGGKARLIARHPGGVEMEIQYQAQQRKRARRDWTVEPATALLGDKAGALHVPPGVRLHHRIPFPAPVAIQLKLAPESQGDVSFAFGVLERTDSGVTVDVARDAKLQVREKGRTVRGATIAARTAAGKLEHVRLEIVPGKCGLTAQLSTVAGKTDLVPLSREDGDAGGRLWLHGLGAGLVFEELHIVGILPNEWLSEALSK